MAGRAVLHNLAAMTSRLRTMMTSKIHRATVTRADLDYVGSVTVDADLLDAADLMPGERVDICDCEIGRASCRERV